MRDRPKARPKRLAVRAPESALDVLRRAAKAAGLSYADYLGLLLVGASKVVEVQEAARAS